MSTCFRILSCSFGVMSFGPRILVASSLFFLSISKEVFLLWEPKHFLISNPSKMVFIDSAYTTGIISVSSRFYACGGTYPASLSLIIMGIITSIVGSMREMVLNFTVTILLRQLYFASGCCRKQPALVLYQSLFKRK